MVNQQLNDYVKDQLQKGYTKEQLRTSLVQYGYQAADVDAALGPTSSHSPMLIIAVVAVIVLVAGTLFFLLSMSRELPSAIQLRLSLQPAATAHAGESLSFTVNVDSDQPLQQEDGKIRYSVIDAANTDVVSKEEHLILEQKTTKKDSIPLPHSLALGMYKLAAKLHVRETEADALSPFNVVPKGSSVRTLSENIVESGPTDQEIIQEIVALAQEDPDRAEKQCKEFANSESADQCYYEAGLTSYNHAFCTPIQDYDKRDACFFNLVLATRAGNLCESITNSNLRGTCQKI